MVLRFTVKKAGTLREAVQSVPVAGMGMVIIIWCPDYFAVQSVIPEKMPKGENPITLLKIAPESFESYESTDAFFNAAVEAAVLESVFHTAKDSDPIEFSQISEENGENEFGYLHARFNRPIDLAAGLIPGAFMNDYIPMKIHGIIPEGVVRSADVSQDPSAIPLPPVATLEAIHFANFMATMETFGMTAVLTVVDNEVFFATEGTKFQPLIMTRGGGVISTREDCQTEPVRFHFHLQNLDIQPGASLSEEVALYNRAEKVFLIWFKLSETRTDLKGSIIYYLH